MKLLRMLKKTDALFEIMSRRLADGTLIICNLLLITVTLEVIVGVFFRYILRNPIFWSEEVARYLLVWMAMVGASVGTQKREHLRLDSFIDLLPGTIQKIIEVLLNILIIWMLLLVFPWLWQWLAGSGMTTRSPAMQIPMVIPLSSLAVGFILIIFQTTVCVVRDLLYLVGIIIENRGSGVMHKEDTL